MDPDETAAKIEVWGRWKCFPCSKDFKKHIKVG